MPNKEHVWTKPSSAPCQPSFPENNVPALSYEHVFNYVVYLVGFVDYSISFKCIRTCIIMLYYIKLSMDS